MRDSADKRHIEWEAPTRMSSGNRARQVSRTPVIDTPARNRRDPAATKGSRDRAHPAEILGTLLVFAAAGSVLTLLTGYWTGIVLILLGAVCLLAANQEQRR